MRVIMLILVAFGLISSVGAQTDGVDVLKARLAESNVDILEGVRLLQKISETLKTNGESDKLINYLDMISSEYKNSEIEAAAISLQIPLLVNKGRFEDVKKGCLYVKNNFTNTQWAQECLYNLGELYLNVYNDPDSALKVFNELKTKYPKSSFISAIDSYLTK